MRTFSVYVREGTIYWLTARTNLVRCQAMTNHAYREYWESLGPEGRRQYAKRAGTTPEYIRVHLIPPAGSSRQKKIPRPDLMERLIAATQGKVPRRDVLDHFYQPDADPSRPAPNANSKTEEAA